MLDGELLPPGVAAVVTSIAMPAKASRVRLMTILPVSGTENAHEWVPQPDNKRVRGI